MNELLKAVLPKLFSGRYILTVACAIVFVYASFRGLIDKDVVATIITMVFTLYFTRSDRGQNGIPKP